MLLVLRGFGGEMDDVRLLYGALSSGCVHAPHQLACRERYAIRASELKCYVG